MMNKSHGNTGAPPSVAAQIARLPDMPMPEIKTLWQRLFEGEAPTYNRQFLERRIAYRLCPESAMMKRAHDICVPRNGTSFGSSGRPVPGPFAAFSFPTARPNYLSNLPLVSY